MRKIAVFTALALIGVAFFALLVEYREDRKHLAWCDGVYHMNISCPKHGQVEIPPEFQAEANAIQMTWCKRVYPQEAQGEACEEYKEGYKD